MKFKSIINLLTICLISQSLLSCGSKENKPKTQIPLGVDLPADWKSENVALDDERINAGWVAEFEDPTFEKTIKEAIMYNNDLRAASFRLEAAQASAKKAGAELTPAVDLNLGGGRSGTGESSGSGMGASVDISWEIDIWGRISSQKEAANQEFYATKSDFLYARQSIAAQTAKAYFLTVEAMQQRDLAIIYVKNYTKTLEVTQAFYKEGKGSTQDIHMSKSDLARSQEALNKAENAYKQSIRSLEILLGKYPAGEFAVGKNFPKIPKHLPAGVPSELLERRPDVLAAANRVNSAFSSKESAKAARLPRLALTTSIGTASDSLSNLGDPTDILWNVIGNLVTPIVDGGARKADVEIATAKEKEAVEIYKKTALNAFFEVESALDKEENLRKREKNLHESYIHAQKTEEISVTKYEYGQGDLLDLQIIRRNTVSAQIELLQIRRELLSERINLYLSLGGDV
ncbi:MAG: NodT family efflux transporter outer membrane factor (OMF) lipoprotein [Rickettsiales bacterium]|jgi:NodT family efflux transporter outer membrane factor (OMF) lipoprotein